MTQEEILNLNVPKPSVFKYFTEESKIEENACFVNHYNPSSTAENLESQGRSNYILDSPEVHEYKLLKTNISKIMDKYQKQTSKL